MGAILVNVYIINSDNLIAGVTTRALRIIGAPCLPPQHSVKQELGALHLAQQARKALATGYPAPTGRRIESDTYETDINLTLMTSVKMNVLGIALIVCGVALLCAALIPKFRSKPASASTEDAIEPFVPQPWVDTDANEELNKKDESQTSP